MEVNFVENIRITIMPIIYWLPSKYSRYYNGCFYIIFILLNHEEDFQATFKIKNKTKPKAHR